MTGLSSFLSGFFSTEADVTVILEVVEIPDGVGFFTSILLGELMECNSAAFTFSLLTLVAPSCLVGVFLATFLDDLKN